jgi:hypothetical protein
MVLPEEAAVIAGVGVRAIYRQVEAGELHFIETEVWPLLICRNSIPKKVASQQLRIPVSSAANKSAE